MLAGLRGFMLFITVLLAILGHYIAYQLYPIVLTRLFIRMTIGPQWYELFQVKLNPMRAYLSFPGLTDIGFVFLAGAGVTGLAALGLHDSLRRKQMPLGHPTQRFFFISTLLITTTSVLLVALRMYEKPLEEEAKRLLLAAVPGKLRTLDATIDGLLPGSSLAAVEDRLKSLGFEADAYSKDVVYKGASASFTKVYELGFQEDRDFWEDERQVVLYGAQNGRLTGWEHRSRRLETDLPYDMDIQMPTRCEILSEYPRQDNVPRPCPVELN